jgi:uncharacterized protein (TIRG00374 family)
MLCWLVSRIRRCNRQACGGIWMWGLVFKVGLTILLISLVFHGRDIPALLEQMVRTDWRAPAVAIVGLLMLSPLLTWRWSTVLSALGHPRSFRGLFPIVWIGTFFGQIIPSGLAGDAARIWLVYKTRLPGVVAVSSMLIDRLFGILAILLFVATAALCIRSVPFDPAVMHGVMLLLAAGICGFAMLLTLDRLPLALRRYRIVGSFGQFSVSLRSIVCSPHRLWRLLVSSIAIQLAVIVIVYVLAMGLSLPVTFVHCLLIVPTSNLVQAIPISIAGWGLREGFFVFAFGQIGIPSSDALALSVLYGLISLLASLPGAVVWMTFRRQPVTMNALVVRPGHESVPTPPVST